MRHFDLVIIGSGSGNPIVDERISTWDIAIVDKGIGPTEASAERGAPLAFEQ